MTDREILLDTIKQLKKLESLERVVSGLYTQRDTYSKAVKDPEAANEFGGESAPLIFWSVAVTVGIYFTWDWWLIFRIPVYLIALFIYGLSLYGLYDHLKYKGTIKSMRQTKKSEYAKALKAGSVDEQRIREAKKNVESAYQNLRNTSKLSPKYQTISICNQLLQYFDEGRADTLKEALNLFETERRHNEETNARKSHMEMMSNQEQAAQKRHAENKKVLQKIRRDVQKAKDELEMNRDFRD